ncbi:MAG: hypothetical protein A2Z35_02590 [Actinobacteria bacterium RBG_19FT_COMBO_36_27]|nr:MAG: hypothetical protein A2Z35_02590 [Actinobacteria bacterium RBG_19FT_COMBO_36_27]
MKKIRFLCGLIIFLITACILIFTSSCVEPEKQDKTGYEKTTTAEQTTDSTSQLPDPPPQELTEEQKLKEIERRQQMAREIERERPSEYEGKKE